MYSQHGEDQFIEEFLVNNNFVVPPIFLDIGAYDGVTFSNSKLFEEKYGWKNILVDANEGVISKTGGLYEFIAPEKDLYGQFHFEADKWGLAHVETTKEAIGKKCITLSELCGRESITEVGILSLDIEGEEAEVLKELFENSSVRPAVVCVEGNTAEEKQKIRDVMANEYSEIGELNVNLIFAIRDRNKYFQPKSKLVKYSDWKSEHYSYWPYRLDISYPVSPQRKWWEFIEIANILFRVTGLDGKKGIGFGVGEEPMTSALASLGSTILATDIGANHESSKDWDNGQLAKNIESLYKPEIIDRDKFDKNVRFEELDMNNILDRVDLVEEFDFSFSCGSIEHIGGIEQTIQFLVNQMEVLKPGGIAVHTTEYNLESNDETLNAHNICLLRIKDLEELDKRLKEKGYELLPIDYSLGEEPEDTFVDRPPHQFHQHLKLESCGFTHTSILLVIRKPKV